MMSDHPFTATDRTRLAVWLARESEDDMSERLSGEYVQRLEQDYRALKYALQATTRRETALRGVVRAQRRICWALASGAGAALIWADLGGRWMALGLALGAVIGAVLAYASEE